VRRIASPTESARELACLVDACRRAVVFTGAGISTESGIPDFRSPGGFWARYQPIDFADFVASEAMRVESWRRKFATEPAMRAARPNRGHRAVADLVRREKAAAVITQNVDSLHQASGVPDDKVVELHGNTTYARCLSCEKRFELDPIRDEFERTGRAPSCDACGGHVKTAVISFGQPMPEPALARSRVETLACDLFLAVGSSLVVYPAASFPVLAKRAGARLAILNRDPTDLDELADAVLNVEIGRALGEAVGVD
jgi:NAD-dependent deacetylase